MQPEFQQSSQADVEAWCKQLEVIGQEYQALFADLAGRMQSSEASKVVYDDMYDSFAAGFRMLASDPHSLYLTQWGLVQDQWQLWQHGMQLLAGQTPAPLIEPARHDRRFRDPAWQEEPFYQLVLQQYLLFSKSVEELVAGLDVFPEKKRSLEFYARQYVSALSPTNFVSTNPEVLRLTLETKGQNLIDGLTRLRDDLANSVEGINVTMTDREAFRIGENVAATPGEVVYENELIQLIQYYPTTEKAFKTPLLIVPPWINKYYVLDLREDNSLVKWLVEQGHTVFLISWRNPGPAQRDLGWADYMQMGIIDAIDAIEQASGEKSVNLLSYCVGGTLAASTVAYLTSTRRGRKIKSVTYMATLQDFRDPGEIGVFINEPILAGLERQLEADGYLDGRVMAFSFNLLRENDLFWSFYINNYLKGEQPAAFDLLYWNTDGTNLPAGVHGWYLRNMYQNNCLVEPGGIELDGVKIDLRKISAPSYFISTREDHIAKWNSTYYGALLPKGPVTFVLGGSGHIAGIVNPPAKNKYGYWTNEALPVNHEEWQKGASFNEGSWWPHWQAWVTDNGYADPNPQKMVAARQPGEGELGLLEPAPGRYVRMSIPEVLAEQLGEELANEDDGATNE